jgi:AraC-like DNA-binding protein
MKHIPLYKFHKHKYGAELLIDVLGLDYIKAGIRRNPIHRENFYCIILITDGTDTLSVNNHSRLVQPGDIVCSRPGEVWSWQPEPQVEGLVLIFEEPFLISFFNDTRFLERFGYLQPNRISPFLHTDTALQERLCHLLSLMKEEIDGSQNKDQHILRAMLYETLMLLNRADSTADVIQPLKEESIGRYVEQFKQTVSEEYTSHHDVEYYADRLCITPNYLNKIIRHTLGATAKNYIHNKVREEAERLLQYTTVTITEISEWLNFDSASYFTRFFKKNTGLTPLQYRERLKSPQK